jgi:hypothetical protein
VSVEEKVYDESNQETVVKHSDITIDSLEAYYAFKDRYKNQPNFIFRKVYSKPRDLKPIEISFKVDGLGRTLFDLTPVRLLHVLSKLNTSESDKALLTAFAEWQGKDLDNPAEKAEIKRKLSI